MRPSRSPSTRSNEIFSSARTMTVSLWAARLPPSRDNTAVLSDRVWDEKMGKAMVTSRSAMRAMALDPIDDAAVTIADNRQCEDKPADREYGRGSPIIDGGQLTEQRFAYDSQQRRKRVQRQQIMFIRRDLFRPPQYRGDEEHDHEAILHHLRQIAEAHA